MKYYGIGTGLFLGLVACTVQADPVQWSVADGGNGHWYEAVLTDTGLTWEQAQQLANGDNGYLATPVTAEENLWISITLLKRNGDLFGSAGYGPHIGGIQNTDSPDYSEPYGGWEWASGDDWSYDNWTECDNCCGGQARMQYMSQFTESGNGWGDVSYGDSNSQFKSYVVEWDHDPSIIQWRIEDGGNGHWYMVEEYGLHDSWSAAQASALAQGGYLATVTSSEENSFVTSLYSSVGDSGSCDSCSSGSAALLGGMQDSKGGWSWVTGESWDFEDWYPGEPNSPWETALYLRCPGQWNDGIDDLDTPCRYAGIVEFTTLPGSTFGACCLDGLCITTAAADCGGNSGSWGGPDSSCADFDCPDLCLADLDGDGEVKVADLLLLIGAWGVCP